MTVFDGESALRKFSREEYSLVLLDLMIPKKSGMEVMRAIRERSTVPNRTLQELCGQINRLLTDRQRQKDGKPGGLFPEIDRRGGKIMLKTGVEISLIYGMLLLLSAASVFLALYRVETRDV